MSRETDEKVERLLRVAGENAAGGVLLTTQRNVAWLTGGRTNRIDGSRETGAGALLVTGDGRRYVLGNAIEMPRLMAEVVDGLSFEAVEYAWIQDQANPAVAADLARSLLPNGSSLAADWPLPQTTLVEPSLMRARVPLVDEEITRYRSLGRDMGRVVGDVCRQVRPGTSEDRVAAVVSAAVCDAGARPLVVLVAGDDRLSRYRHPVPTSTPWHKVVMIVVCAEKHGLIVALSRLISVVREGRLGERTHATARVFERLLHATRAAVSGAELYDAAVRAYADVGFAGEEHRHHQGGATGYRTREWLAHPSSREQVATKQAFAWNPSITGTKVEDTVFLADGRYEVLTTSPDWPSIPIAVHGQTLSAADVLILDR
jgi:Xaa-Pro aminopeptidase